MASKIEINAKSVEDGLEKLKVQLDMAVRRSLEECGLVAEGYAKKECPVDTGNLRNSITHKVSGDSVYIGTNVEYGKYVEFGTGTHSTKGGRRTPWVYKDSHGEWHMTSGSKPHPFLKPALANHVSDYKRIITKELQKL